MADHAPRAARGLELALGRPERALSALLAAAALLVLLAAAVLLVPPAMRVTRYVISGNASMSREEVLSAALIHDREYFFSIDTARVAAALSADPRVASATASRLFPNGLRISVKERVAVAAALASIKGRTAAVCIDSEGVAFAEASAETAAAVPVLSGLRFEDFRLGTRLPPALAALVASIGKIQAAEPALLSAISEIRVVATKAAPELLIYPLGQRVPVRAGASLDAPTLRSIILVLDVLGTKGIAADVREIDFRTGTVVYRSKEGPTG
jgi:cell division septal protein FtsQ